jgi:hypothetical protein
MRALGDVGVVAGDGAGDEDVLIHGRPSVAFRRLPIPQLVNIMRSII